MEMPVHIFADKSPRQFQVSFNCKPGYLHPVCYFFITQIQLADEADKPFVAVVAAKKWIDEANDYTRAPEYLPVCYYVTPAYVDAKSHTPHFNCHPFEVIKSRITRKNKQIVLQTAYCRQGTPAYPIYRYK